MAHIALEDKIGWICAGCGRGYAPQVESCQDAHPGHGIPDFRPGPARDDSSDKKTSYVLAGAGRYYIPIPEEMAADPHYVRMVAIAIGRWFEIMPGLEARVEPKEPYTTSPEAVLRLRLKPQESRSDPAA